MITRIATFWSYCEHYRGQIAPRSPMLQIVLHVWRIKVALIRLTNRRLELVPYSRYTPA